MKTVSIFRAVCVCAVWFSLLGVPGAVWAYRPLGDLTLDDGATWEIVGVSLYNTRLVPFQSEVGTWIVSSNAVIKQIQNDWNFEAHFDDYCEWHYALKIYRNRKLFKTLKINLVCNYITEGVLSYQFTPQLLYDLKPYMRTTFFTSVTYYSLQNLRMAVDRFRSADDVYLYTDVRPYLYDGFFVIGIDDLPWNANRDSIQREMTQRVATCIGTEDFYLEPNILFLSADYQKMSLRYSVYCSKTLFLSYRRNVANNNITAGWRDHFETFEAPVLAPDARKVRITVVGLSRRRYQEIMRGLTPAPISGQQTGGEDD